MPNRFVSPNQQFVNNEGLPIAGGWLYFYATNTSTPQNTYTTAALSVANSNPIELDSDGYAGNVFLQNLAYKVVLKDSDLNEIWTMDPVYSSDYSTFAQFLPWNGNPNGSVAGNAGTQGSLPGSSAVWDYQNNILYVCTTTGTTTTAVWTAVNAAAATAINFAPQGYLTLSNDSSNPILTADAIASTAVYYSPYLGYLIPVYNGSTFINYVFTQLSLTLSASQASNTIYDVFVFYNSGVLTLVVGPAWASSTAGSCSRGTGGGTTQIQRLNGLWVNAVQITGRNGATTYTIPANTATFLGSIYVDGTAGQVTCHRSVGQNRKWGVSNAFNRNKTLLQVTDATGSWAYNSTTVRQSNGATGNKATSFACLAEEEIDVLFSQNITLASLNNAVIGTIGIGVNSITAFTGKTGTVSLGTGAIGATTTSVGSPVAIYGLSPALGINNFNCCESSSAAGTTTFGGTSAGMSMTIEWMA